MFTLGQRPRGNPSAVWALSTTTTDDATNRQPLRMATGAPAAPTPTDHSTAYPGGGVSKKIMEVAIAFIQTARSPKQHENRGIEPKHRGYAQAISCNKLILKTKNGGFSTFAGVFDPGTGRMRSAVLKFRFYRIAFCETHPQRRWSFLQDLSSNFKIYIANPFSDTYMPQFLFLG